MKGVLGFLNRLLLPHADKFLLLAIKLAEIVVIILIAALLKKHFGLRYIKKIVRNLDEDTEAILRSAVAYGIWLTAIVIVLNIMGIKIESLITSLGLMSVAIGFAAQATISNFISGLMIMFDRSVRIGDVIEVNGNIGTIHSIGILSTRLKTFDNLLIRVPNRELLDSDVKNYTFFNIRRFEILVGVSYSTDLQKAREVILKALSEIEDVLDDPAPLVWVTEFADSSINLSVKAWCSREKLFDVRDIAAQRIKEALDEAGIEIPFPQVVVHMAEEEQK